MIHGSSLIFNGYFEKVTRKSILAKAQAMNQKRDKHGRFVNKRKEALDRVREAVRENLKLQMKEEASIEGCLRDHEARIEQLEKLMEVRI